MSQGDIRTIHESGFVVTLPKDLSFRLCEMAPYERLKGQHLKEMDVGWFDAKERSIVLLELKGKEVGEEWKAQERDGSKNGCKRKPHEHLIENLGNKGTDCLLIFSAVWAKTEVGEEFQRLLPQDCWKYPAKGKIKLFFLVDTPSSRRELLLEVKHKLNETLSGRLQLFGIQRVLLLDFNKAREMGLPVERATH